MSTDDLKDQVKTADTIEIYNVTMTNADTEYSQALHVNAKAFFIHTRDESPFRIAFVTGKVATPVAPWGTVLAGKGMWFSGLESGDQLTVYFASDSAGKIIEIFVMH